MCKMFILTLVCLLGVGSAQFSHAEGMNDQTYTAKLLELNRIRPDQNPALALGKNQLNARIVDKNQRTLGQVGDIIIAPDGKFRTILTKIDTSGFRENVAFDIASYITAPTPDTFTVALDKDQLKQNMTQLIASASKTSGDGPPLTLKALQMGDIFKTDMTPVAKVKDVLIDTKKMQIVSLLVTMSSGNNRGTTVAIPYEAENTRLDGNKAALTVTDAQASVMASMATKRY